MTVNCERYVRHEGVGKCLGIFKSVEDARRIGPIKDVSGCPYDAKGIYAGKDSCQCFYSAVVARAKIRIVERNLVESTLV